VHRVCAGFSEGILCLTLFHPHSRTSSLQRLSLRGNPISAPVLKSVYCELVLCQMRNTQVTEIDAYNKGFDDSDAARIAEALRCACLVHVVA
jgi:hypothetical protein